MANKDLFEQAIADAKKLKELSMANAKQVIEEAFAPKIQEMFRLKLSEMEGLEEDTTLEEGGDTLEEDYAEEGAVEPMEEGDSDINEITLEEILAELELEEGMTEDEGKMMEPEKPMEEAKKDDDKEDDDDASDKPADDGSEKVAEVDLDTLIAKITDAVMNAMGTQGAGDLEGDLEGGAEGDMMPGEEPAGDDTINLEEILASLQTGETLEEASKKKMHKKAEKAEKEEKEEEHKKEKEDHKAKEKLKEAIETISYLKSQLNEVNLLNAKLLYVNKIFKAKSLSEAQKLSVVNAFDRATTIKEAKNIYETLQDSLTTTGSKRSTIKESVGFASKPIGSAPVTPIVDSDAYVFRMQQLAGIKKPNI